MPITLGFTDYRNPTIVTLSGISPLTFDVLVPGTDALINVEGAAEKLCIDADLAFGAISALVLDVDAAALGVGDGLLLSGSFGSASIDLTKNGTGLATPAGDNNLWTGTLTVNNGALRATHNFTLGSASGTGADATTANTGGTLVLAANVTVANERVILSGGAARSIRVKTRGSTSRRAYVFHTATAAGSIQSGGGSSRGMSGHGSSGRP